MNSLSLRAYHDQGRAADPRDAVLSASQLVAGFCPHPKSNAHPYACYLSITGEPRAQTGDMLAGTMLHALLLDRLEPVPIDPKVATWTATGLGAKGNLERVVSIEGTVRLGNYLVGPPCLDGKNTLVGQEQRRVLLQLAGELGLEIAGSASGDLDTDGMTMARRAYEEAVGLAEWWLKKSGPDPDCFVCEGKGRVLMLCDQSDETNEMEPCFECCEASDLLPPSVLEARRILDSLARREQSYFAEIGGLRLRARPDGEMDDGTLVNLKRTAFAHPRRFWRTADECGWWLSEAFYELVMMTCRVCEGSGHVASGDGTEECFGCYGSGTPVNEEGLPQYRSWTIVAIAPPTKTTPPQAFVYEAPPALQTTARAQVAEMLDRYRECLESGEWWTAEERLPVQPPPYWYTGELDPARYTNLDHLDEEEADDEPPWDPGDNIPTIDGVRR